MNNKIDMTAIKGLTQDSRAVKKGYLFAALPGLKTDGRHYMADAVRNGATAILAPQGTQWPDNVPQEGINFITDENPRRTLALLAATFYGRQPATIAAVTGTNGKTSTVHFIKQIWTTLGYKAASIGTLGVRTPDGIRSGSMTTPDPVSLHAELADLAAAGVTHLAMEASSHGLDQYRLDGVRVSAAGFTNLTRDHLDYHGDMESYFKSKSRLFSDVLIDGGTAVLNADVPEFAALKKTCGRRGGFFKKNIDIIDYGVNAQHLAIRGSINPTAHGIEITIAHKGQMFPVALPLVGEFQVYNALCAAGIVLSQEKNNAVKTKDIITALSNLQGPPGRLELVKGHPSGAAVYVDYAHTPDALENVLKSLRPHTEGRLFCVFGCGGDRDRGKRPVMGKISADLADIVIVTDDNPRSENPAAIRRAIIEGGPSAREIGDRHEAIRAAVSELQSGDVLLIAGKGHEQGQIFADRTDPFDDFQETTKAIREL